MTTADGIPPKDRSQVRVLRNLFRAAERLADIQKKRLKSESLSLTEFDAIAALGNTDGLRMKDIASSLATSASASNATRVCIALEKKGLVTRTRASDNDREVVARLTPAGEAKFERCFLQMVRYTETVIDAALTEPQQREMVELLSTMLEKLEAP